METITIRFQEDVLKNIDKTIAEHNYNSRTEFLRDAVRDKLNNLNKEDLIKEFMKFRGQAKKRTTRKQNRKTAELVLNEFARERGWET